MPKVSKLFLLVICIAFFLRIIYLDRIPVGISNDELDYILNAKAVFLSGSDISNTWNPFSLKPPASSFPQAEIPPLITFLPVGLLPLSLLYSKIVYVLFGGGIVMLLYLIAKQLFGRKEALFIGAVAAINPWLLFLGRTAYDAPIAIFFLLLGFYFTLTLSGWWILIAAFPFALGFYSYIGIKVIFFPIVVIFALFAKTITTRKNTKQLIVLLSICSTILLFYLFTTFHGQNSRLSEIASPNMPVIKNMVDGQRRLSVISPFTNIFANKYVVFTVYEIGKYFNAFSPDFLFLHGDGKPLFSVWYHGVFYYTDVIFLLLGLIGMYIKHKRVWIYLISLMLIAPIPSVVSNVGISYAIRSILLCPVLILFIGFGIFYAYILVKKSQKILFLLVISVAYFLQFLNFANIYFFENPIYNPESFNLSARVLAKYLQLGKDNIYVVSGDPKTQLKQYLFYANAYNANTYEQIAKMYKTANFKLNNVSFVTCNQTNIINNKATIIYESGSKCVLVPTTTTYLTIAQLSDGGSIYSIINDVTCSKYKLAKFPSNITFDDLNVEKLPEREFCKKFITNYFQ